MTYCWKKEGGGLVVSDIFGEPWLIVWIKWITISEIFLNDFYRPFHIYERSKSPQHTTGEETYKFCDEPIFWMFPLLSDHMLWKLSNNTTEKDSLKGSHHSLVSCSVVYVCYIIIYMYTSVCIYLCWCWECVANFVVWLWGVLLGPLFCLLLIHVLVILVDSCDFWNERVVRVGVI